MKAQILLSNSDQQIFIYIAIGIGIFFLVREVFCWYWKINSIVDELKKMNANLDLLTKDKKEVKYGEVGEMIK
jgi:hypothetical protein